MKDKATLKQIALEKIALENKIPKHDGAIIQQLISLCRNGVAFYQDMATRVEDYNLRSLFRLMANTRKAIASDLSDMTKNSGQAVPKSQSPIAELFESRYFEVRHMLPESSPGETIEQLESIEESTLHLFKTSVKKIQDRELAKDLSVQAATVQITHDRMRSVREHR
ncbi:PA2169 family four-helix-bundle protein [Hahella ganghwensis]|uniref:PA2169 family four-helix-bundle protein n=1 Tax=Hahella ganghwensis TaxID=286420 RepID=UPI00035D7FF5|nr:PA2169 family four-helix-bundle protein [Hahella ganghwensis]